MSEVDEFLKALPPDQRRALEELRKMIREAAPEATEKISYRMPMFFHHGPLVSFAAFKDHCSFFVQSTEVIAAHKDILKAYSTAKGTVHFTAEKPLPASLVKKLVKARLAENEARNALKVSKTKIKAEAKTK